MGAPGDGGVLVPGLRDWLLPRLAPGTTLVCDTRSVPKHSDVRSTIEVAWRWLERLPPCSQDFQPNELVFAKKAHQRAAASRTLDGFSPRSSVAPT